jgi:cytochrome c
LHSKNLSLLCPPQRPKRRRSAPLAAFAALAGLAALLAFAGLCRAQSQAATSSKSAHPNLGRPLAPDEIRRLDITVTPDGRGLPDGSGSVEQGAKVYAEKCQVCHGPQGKGVPLDPLTGGIGTIASAKPLKTPVSYWPSATTIFDYVRRAMPLRTPESLSNDEVYALTAYILSIDAVVPKDAVLDAKSLPQVKMPNRDGFLNSWPPPKHQ